MPQESLLLWLLDAIDDVGIAAAALCCFVVAALAVLFGRCCCCCAVGGVVAGSHWPTVKKTCQYDYYLHNLIRPRLGTPKQSIPFHKQDELKGKIGCLNP